MGTEQTKTQAHWSVDSISIDESYDAVIQKKGETSLKTDIEGRPSVRCYQQGEKLRLSIFFSPKVLFEQTGEDVSEPSVIHVKGLELTGPDDVSLSEQDSTQKIAEVLGEPDKVMRHQLEENYFWRYDRGEFRIDIHIRGDKAVTFHLKKIFAPIDHPDGSSNFIC